MFICCGRSLRISLEKMDFKVPKSVGLTMACYNDVIALDYYYVIRYGRAKLVIDITFRSEEEPLWVENLKYAYHFTHFKFARMCKRVCERGFCVTLKSHSKKNPVGGVKFFDLVTTAKFNVSKFTRYYIG